MNNIKCLSNLTIPNSKLGLSILKYQVSEGINLDLNKNYQGPIQSRKVKQNLG